MSHIYHSLFAAFFAKQSGKTASSQCVNFFAAVLLLFILPAKLFAQAPAIGYSSPQNYPANIPITALSPASSGGAVSALGYSSSPVNIFSGTGYSGVAFDTFGNIYTFDYSNTSNKKLVKLSPTGTNPVTLISFLSAPEDITIDANNNVYALDGGTLYKITPGGTASSIHSFSNPTGVAVDAAGNIYVSRYSSSLTSIIEIPAAGGADINVGSGLSYMTDVTVDAAGNLYVCNDNDASIKKIPADGSGIVTIASGFVSFSIADLSQIVADPMGNLFFSEANGGKVSEIPAGSNTPVAIGSGFLAPKALALDALGDLFVSDGGTLKEFKPVGGYFISPALPPGLSFDQTTGTISGTPTAVTAATDYKVTAYNSQGSNTATVNVTINDGQTVSTDANLTALAISDGSFSTAFDKSTFSYSVSVPYSVTGVTLTPTIEQANATVKIYGHLVTSGTPSLSVPLAAGVNTIYVVVMAQDGITKNIYAVAVTRAAASSIADLGDLGTIAGALSPAFDAATTSYTATVPNGTTSTTVTPTSTDAGATIQVRVNGGSYSAVGSGSASGSLALKPGNNPIDVQVTAQDGTTTKTYTISVTRIPLKNALLTTLTFDPYIKAIAVSGPDYKDYTGTVSNTVSSITVTPVTQDPIATVTVNGVAVTSGTSSASIPLSIGANVINTVVTAQDGITTKTYSITVTRQGNALLSTLTFSPPLTITPVAGPYYKNYTGSLPSTVSSVQVTPVAEDPTSTIKVNGVTVASGATSDPIVLNMGANTVNTVVTAADGVTTKTYSIVITRVYSTLLTSLKFNPFIKAATVSGPDYKDYTATVSNSVSSVTVTPLAQDPTSAITVNGVTVASGTASTAIPLNVGDNTITTVVTAFDGSSTRTYSITITRQVNALLASLTFSPRITTTTVSGPDYKDYTATVSNAVSSVTVTPVTQDPTSKVTVNGTTVPSGTASAAIPLAVGDNTVATVVTAQDGTTINTYSTVITRLAPSGSASLYDEKLVAVAPVRNTDIVVHQNVSPNGDGNSDVLLIDGITTYPENTLQIMNRNGSLVYEVKGYDNTSKAFDGHASNGKLQQAGTYFYSLEYKDGNDIIHKTGFIVLKY
jgi:gliding motility-associated-like protein